MPRIDEDLTSQVTGLIPPQDRGTLGLLVFVATILGLKDLIAVLIPTFLPSFVAAYITPTDLAVYLILLLVLACIALKIRSEVRAVRIKPIPAIPTIFNPFKVVDEQHPFTPWPRTQEASELAKQLEHSKHTHSLH
jgi:hypothetical protein